MTTHLPVPSTTIGVRRTVSRIAGGLSLAAAASLLPLVHVAPAFAATNVICVGNPGGTCNHTAPSIAAAILAADATNVVDTILVGPGTYSDGPYHLADVTLKGSGRGATVLTLPSAASSDEYVVADGATVRNLTIKLAVPTADGDRGLSLSNNSSVVNVMIDGVGASGAIGIDTTNSAISKSEVEVPYGIGIASAGGSTVTDSTISAGYGFRHSTATTDRLSRVKISARQDGISTDSGTVNADDVLIDLGTSTRYGLVAENPNPGTTPMTINANHVTIVGGAAGSKGVYANAATQNARQVSKIQLRNSIVRGPETALAVSAGNNGLQGGPSTATITTSYSNWSSKSENAMANGTAQVLVGPGRLNVDPAFVDAAHGNYRLATSSPVVDKGDAAGGGPALDLARKPRIGDGDGDGTAVRDMGAYEMYDHVAPQTRFVSKPAKIVHKGTVTFRFRSNETGVTFKCRLDRRAWRVCTSPKKVRIKVGKHRFSVRATDAAGNTDATPATYRFRRAAS